MTLRPDMSDVSICDDKYSFFALLSLTNSIQKAPITLSSRQMKLKNSFDIQRINCYRIYGLSSFHWLYRPVESAETGWKRENVLPHVSLPHCTWPPYSPDRAPFLLPGRLDISSATSSRPVLVSHCHSANLSPRQQAGHGEEENQDKDQLWKKIKKDNDPQSTYLWKSHTYQFGNLARTTWPKWLKVKRPTTFPE